MTRLVGRTFYSRIVLKTGPNGRLTSVDSRPSDSLALALQSKTPVFVSKRIARRATSLACSQRSWPCLPHAAGPPQVCWACASRCSGAVRGGAWLRQHCCSSSAA